ncbi:iron ABC transporter ATP-binding protein [Sinomicrobium sp. M5D2P9]
MIEIHSIGKKYGRHPVLKDINLSVPAGKVVSLIGPNGAGKSTLLSLIAGLEKPEQGNISIDGKGLGTYSLKTLSKKLSFLKQHNVFDLKLKVSELIAFGRFPHSQGHLNGEDHEKIEEAIAMMDLSPIRDSYIDEISGGQRQLVFLAMIVAQDTEYILLDEPLNNLDMRHAVDIMQAITRLARELGKTIVIVIHDINFAANYSDYIIGLKDGEVICDDETTVIVREDMLKKLYGIDFRITRDNATLLCNYYKI